MPKRLKPHSDSEAHLADLQRLLSDFASELGRPDLREKVQALVPSFHKLRELGISLMPESVGAAGKDRILAYFRKYPLTVIEGDELMVVSGIGEWARRVRELRVESGWMINSGASFSDLGNEGIGSEERAQLTAALGVDPFGMRPDQYVLVSAEQDRDAAFRWNVLNEVRKMKLSVKDKIITYLRKNVGKPVLGEELRYLAGDRSEWARRTRELRTEEGWPLVTRQTGRPDLPVGVYLLERDEQAEVHDRKIPDPVRVEVLRRDAFRCRSCGWRHEDAVPGDPRQFLELHHIVRHADKGANVAANLITLCNVDHDRVHREKSFEKTIREMAL